MSSEFDSQISTHLNIRALLVTHHALFSVIFGQGPEGPSHASRRLEDCRPSARARRVVQQKFKISYISDLRMTLGTPSGQNPPPQPVLAQNRDPTCAVGGLQVHCILQVHYIMPTRYGQYVIQYVKWFLFWIHICIPIPKMFSLLRFSN